VWSNSCGRSSVEVVAVFNLAKHPAKRPFAGFGTQYNQNVFAARSRQVGVTDENVAEMEERVSLLAPHIVRVFFSADAFDDADLMRSFHKTMTLAQQTGGVINVTLQGLGPKVIQQHPRLITQFAELVSSLLDQPQPITKLKWVTLRNEPNGAAPIKQQLYAECYDHFDAELARLGVRARVGLMGGDLLHNNQEDWFNFLSTQKALKRVLDAYSIHVYWNYSQPRKLVTRLKEVREFRDRLRPPGKTMPLYVMEYGVRGIRKGIHGTEDPGFWRDKKTRIADTNVNAFQRCWFTLEAAARGYSGIVAWDAYHALYDKDKKNMRHYGLLGPPTGHTEPWAKRPAFRAQRLLMRAVQPGWHGIPLSGGSSAQRVVAFANPADPHQLTIAGLDTNGAQLNSGQSQKADYTIKGLPANTQFQLCYWNRDGDGLNSFDDERRSDGSRAVGIKAPLHSMFVLTTLHLT
jgi:hypothetical protein